MAKQVKFVHPELGEIIGYASLAEFEEATEAWDDANPGHDIPLDWED